MVAINPRKQKFAVMHGSFAADGVRDFLYDLSQGRGTSSLSTLTALPDVENSMPWDGKDAPVRQPTKANSVCFYIAEFRINLVKYRFLQLISDCA